MSDQRIIEIEILRYRPEQEDTPQWCCYEVTFTDDMTVLQGLQHIKDQIDGSLSFRWSCRMAICGSCGMMINNEPALSCQTFLRDIYPHRVRVEALSHFPIERDLIVDMSDFMEKLESITPYIVPEKPRTIEEGEYLQSPKELATYEQFSACINCLLCYAACPQYGINTDFTGPGVLALLHRYNADSRDGARKKRMEVINGDNGVWGCTLVGYCSEVCPKGVDPANAVNRNKIDSTLDYFAHFFVPVRSSND